MAEPKPSKLDIIRRSLEENPDIVYEEPISITHIDENGDFYDQHQSHDYAHTVHYSVAPKKGIFDTNELNLFLYGSLLNKKAIGGLEPKSITEFQEDHWELTLGELFYEEIIGKRRDINRRFLYFKDQEFNDSLKLPKGVKEIQNSDQMKYVRGIWIKAYPSREIMDGEPHSHYISKNALEGYKPRTPWFFDGLLSLLPWRKKAS